MKLLDNLSAMEITEAWNNYIQATFDQPIGGRLYARYRGEESAEAFTRNQGTVTLVMQLGDFRQQARISITPQEMGYNFAEPCIVSMVNTAYQVAASHFAPGKRERAVPTCVACGSTLHKEAAHVAFCRACYDASVAANKAARTSAALGRK